MRKIQLLTLFGVMFTFGCYDNSNPIYSTKLDKELAGLKKLVVSQDVIDSIRMVIMENSSTNFPVYAPTGEKLTQVDVVKKKINVTVDCFGENIANLKAVVFRNLTKAELESFFETSNKEQKNEQKNVDELTTKDAPLFSATDVNGESVDLQKLKGKVVVLNFWFISCHACVQEMPELNQIKAEFKDKDVVFIGLTFDKLDKTKVFLAKTKFDFQIIAEAKPIFDKFGIQLCPVTLVIDKNGKITSLQLGYDPIENVSKNKLQKNISVALNL